MKSFFLSIFTVAGFFLLLELSLRVAGYQPHIKIQNMELPYWIAGLDSTFVDDYKNRLKILGEVNEDIYAYRPDPLLGYLLKPNYRRKIAGYSSVFPVDNMPQWTLVSGQDGYRTGTNEGPKNKEDFPGKSVFILGDSSSFGWGVDFDETFGFVVTEILNRSLRPGDAPYRIVNRAMPGFSTFHGLRAIRQMNDIKPGDRVLVSLGSNDHSPASMTDHGRSVKQQSAPAKLRREFERLLFFKMLKSFWVSVRVPFADGTDRLVNRVPVEEYRKNLGIIFETIKGQGGNPIFVSICNFKDYASAALELSNAGDIPFIDFIEQVRPLLDNIPRRFPEKFMRYFDAYGEKMEENEIYSVLFPDGCHPNAIGHRLLGEILFEVLNRNSLEIAESGRKTD